MKLRQLIKIIFSKKEEPQERYHRHEDLLFEQVIVEKILRHGEEPKKKKKFRDLRSRKLPFDLIPLLQANRNVRSLLEFVFFLKKDKPKDEKPHSSWQIISRDKNAKAGGRCKYCGESSKKYGKTYDTECHESWSFDPMSKIQKLVALESVCCRCHAVKHMNQHDKEDADIPQQYKDEAKKKFESGLWRYAKINRISFEEAKLDYQQAKEEVDKLSETRFTLDVSLLKKQGFLFFKESFFDCHSSEFEVFLKKFTDKD